MIDYKSKQRLNDACTIIFLYKKLLEMSNI